MGSKQIIRKELLAAVHELHHGDVLLVRVPNERFNYQYVEEPDTRPAPRLPSSHRLASEAIRCTAGSRGNTSPTNTRCHRLHPSRFSPEPDRALRQVSSARLLPVPLRAESEWHLRS
jgi:hypothetical protein